MIKKGKKFDGLKNLKNKERGKAKKIFVSGCYDIIHAGHIQFFEDARALGGHLTVNFASNAVLRLAKGREGSYPEDHKKKILESLRSVDEAVSSSNCHPVFDFEGNILTCGADVLAVTEDDKHKDAKEEFCRRHGIEFCVLPKRSALSPLSTTKILSRIKNIGKVPLRVDFAGGWLDVPRFSRMGAWVVNCSVSPLVSLRHWPYKIGGGLGGSAARSILEVRDGVRSEIKMGVGWQDPAVISETGLCVWRSGRKPALEMKRNPDFLAGKMLILWLGMSHHTPSVVDKKRDYGLIARASKLAKKAVEKMDIELLSRAVNMSFVAQKGEGMDDLPAEGVLKKALAKKYLGGGWGGYALYIFRAKKERDIALRKNKNAKKIEPYIRG